VNKAKVEPETVQGTLRHSLIQTTLDLFHDIRDIGLSTVDASLGQRFIQKFSRRSDKWGSHTIFLVPRLFPHEHDVAFGFRSPKTVRVRVFERSHASQAPACFHKLLVVTFLVLNLIDTDKPAGPSVGLR
jgi:hypothetical protein